MKFRSHILLVTILLFLKDFANADNDADELIDIDKPEVVTYLEDYMFDTDTSDRCYYINKILLCLNMNEHRFDKALENKKVDKITKLRLKDSELPIDSKYLEKYKDMQEIYLEDCVPSSLKLHDFPNLNRIVFKNCRIENLNYQMIPFTDKLKIVEIDYNKIEHISVDSFKRSTRIEKLDLSHNNLKAIDRAAFGMLTELTELKLDYNYLKVLHEDLLVNCTKLQRLSLGHNMLFTLEFYFFDKIRRLEYLDISYNPLFNFDYGTIFSTRLPHLKTYRIDGLPCRTLQMKFFETLKRHFYLMVSEKEAHIIERRACVGPSPNTFCMYKGDLQGEVRERLWWEGKTNNILCVDYYGYQWRNSLRPHSRPNITELAEDLFYFTDYLTRREVYAVEMLAMKRFLKKLVEEVSNVHKKIGTIRYYDVYGYDRCESL